MSELIKNGSHGNNIFILRLADQGLIRKISYDEYSHTYLYSDYHGYSWYQNVQDINLFSPKLVKLKCSLQLDLKLVRGRSVYHLAPINKTYLYVEKIIDHYISIWKSSTKVPCHGDLTLANILFYKNNPIVIDWEHFDIDGECWGFDISYLVLSSLILPFLNNKKISDKEFLIFRNLWIYLKELGINTDLINRPFTFFNNIFNTTKKWEKIISDSPSKLFTNLVSNEFIDYFESNLLKNI